MGLKDCELKTMFGLGLENHVWNGAGPWLDDSVGAGFEDRVWRNVCRVGLEEHGWRTKCGVGL